MSKMVWNVNDGKYVTTEVIQRCWSKAIILTATWKSDINSSVGSAIITESHKVVSKELCDELFHLMSDVKLIAQKTLLDTSNTTGAVFKCTFANQDNNIYEEEMSKMAKTWINIEDDIEIMNEVVYTELYTIYNQYEDNVFCINDDSEDENDLLILTEVKNNYMRMEIMDFLDNIQSYF